MIWSVSTSARSSTADRPLIVVDRRPWLQLQSRMSTKRPSMAAAAAICGETRWVRPPRPWRPSKLRFEVEAQRSPGASDVGVHAEAHRAAGDAPVEAGRAEDLVEALGLGLRLDLLRARHDHRVDAASDLAALDDLGGGAQVADARVRARADEDAVERDLLDRRARLEVHVAAARARRPRVLRLRARPLGDGATMSGVGAPRDLRRERARRRRRSRLSNARALVGAQRRASARRPARSPPCGAPRGPRRHANVVSSGAIMPARPPPSIVMLQTVMRPSIESASIAGPAYSTTWPVAPPTPIWPIVPRIRSLAVTPKPSSPS